MSGDTDDLFRLLGASEGITQHRADLATVTAESMANEQRWLLAERDAKAAERALAAERAAHEQTRQALAARTKALAAAEAKISVWSTL